MAEKILIVDDEVNIVKLLDCFLRDEGYEVVTAFDGEEALDKAREFLPNLIILDVILPKIDGFRVCSILKSDEKLKDIPIIMVTAKGEAMSIKTGMELGAVSYIGKPFDVQMLLKIIRGILNPVRQEGVFEGMGEYKILSYTDRVGLEGVPASLPRGDSERVKGEGISEGLEKSYE